MPSQNKALGAGEAVRKNKSEKLGKRKRSE